MMELNNFNQQMNQQEGNMIATDGSGGPGWIHKTLRKVATAMAVIKFNEGNNNVE